VLEAKQSPVPYPKAFKANLIFSGVLDFGVFFLRPIAKPKIELQTPIPTKVYVVYLSFA